MIEAQEKTITDLLQAVKEQHDQLDNQKTKIKILEEKVKTFPQDKHLLSATRTTQWCSLNDIMDMTLLWHEICTIC